VNKKILSSNAVIFCLVFLLTALLLGFQDLPSNIYPNMLDLLFGFSGLEVQNTFDSLGRTGRVQYIYSSLTLDAAFPILYALLFISILLKLNEGRVLVLCLPILAGIFDIGENIFISLMMSSNSFSEIPESQIFIASLLNQCKWSMCLCSVIMILFKLIANSLKKEN
tara:strand:- start:376 stop:876 length:501 start_codon:yes stop_codon:yes gene_type:complete